MTTVDSKENQVEMPNVPVKNVLIKDQASEERVAEVQKDESALALVEEQAQEEDAEEVADDENATADQPEVVSLEDANDLFAAGTQALALNSFEEAAEKLSIAVEAQ